MHKCNRNHNRQFI